mgnify:CR=1 FL=1
MFIVDSLNSFQHLGGQCHINAVDIAFELLHGRSANNRAGQKGPIIHKSQRHLCRIKLMLLSQGHILFRCSDSGVTAVARVIRKQRQARTLRLGPSQVFAREHAEAH